MLLLTQQHLEKYILGKWIISDLTFSQISDPVILADIGPVPILSVGSTHPQQKCHKALGNINYLSYIKILEAVLALINICWTFNNTFISGFRAEKYRQYQISRYV